MHLPDHMDYCWLSYDATRIEAWEAMLSDEERGRLHGFGHEGRQHEFVMGRAAVRTLLGDWVGCAPAEVPLTVRDSGALDVPGHPYHVSLAHSGRHAISVVATQPVGVDLEEIAPRRPDLDRFLLHPDEAELLDTLPVGRDRSLILVWTLKEATLKGLGTGFRLSPKKLKLDVDTANGRATARVDGEQKQTWQVRFAEHEGCYWAVATEAGAR